MKKNIVLLIGFCLLITMLSLPCLSYAQAPPPPVAGEKWLGCDIEPGVVSSIVEIDGTPTEGGVYPCNLNGAASLCLYPADALFANPGDSHTFRAKFIDVSGLESGWSAPFSARLPGVPGGLNVGTVQQMRISGIFG